MTCGRVALEEPCTGAWRRHRWGRVANREQWSGPEAHHLRGTAYAGAGHPSTAPLGRHVRKRNARDVIAQVFAS